MGHHYAGVVSGLEGICSPNRRKMQDMLLVRAQHAGARGSDCCSTLCLLHAGVRNYYVGVSGRLLCQWMQEPV